MPTTDITAIWDANSQLNGSFFDQTSQDVTDPLTGFRFDLSSITGQITGVEIRFQFSFALINDGLSTAYGGFATSDQSQPASGFDFANRYNTGENQIDPITGPFSVGPWYAIDISSEYASQFGTGKPTGDALVAYVELENFDGGIRATERGSDVPTLRVTYAAAGQTIVTGRAIETNVARAATVLQSGGGSSVQTARVTETNSAIGVVIEAPRSIQTGRAIETNTPRPVSVSRDVITQRVQETNNARGPTSFVIGRNIIVGKAIETNVAIGVTIKSPRSVTTGRAIETNNARSAIVTTSGDSLIPEYFANYG
ncbi:MAG: hypothetical protein AAFX06_21370 [Planctomycetota bacterium]